MTDKRILVPADLSSSLVSSKKRKRKKKKKGRSKSALADGGRPPERSLFLGLPLTPVRNCGSCGLFSVWPAGVLR